MKLEEKVTLNKDVVNGVPDPQVGPIVDQDVPPPQVKPKPVLKKKLANPVDNLVTVISPQRVLSVTSIDTTSTTTQKKNLYKMNEFNSVQYLDTTMVTQGTTVQIDEQSGTVMTIQDQIKANLEKHIEWKSKVVDCISNRWNNSFCVTNQNKKITVTNYLGGTSDYVPTS